jgi:hydrogenase maturation protease
MSAETPYAGRALVIGFGNPDRQDDGVGWHVVQRLAERLGRVTFETIDGDACAAEPSPVLLCTLQLVPEMAETVRCFERVCFVDAHTGAYADDLRFEPLQPSYQTSPFTHHLTPETLLQLAASLYGRAPEAAVCSVRGYEFGFANSLSQRTAALVEEAVRRICVWLGQP